jgi:predicted Fe-Mo cluster-binding NifX family protein
MIVCAPITTSGDKGPQIDPRWGRANWVALADLQNGEITNWQEIEVSWDRLHDEGTHGSHHARIVKFLKEHGVEAIVAHHLGDGMVRMLETMKIPVYFDAAGDARAAIREAISNS